MKKNQDSLKLQSDEIIFSPFYERKNKILTSLSLGVIFFVVHYLSTGKDIFSDWSWFLSILITIAMLCLYWATDTLRNLIYEFDIRLNKGSKEFFMTLLKNNLSDRNFVLSGFFFGFVNCLFGLLFGLIYDDGFQKFTILCGYFLAGFVCGMAVFGIYGVFKLFLGFSQKTNLTFDFTSPDRCGGTSFLGKGLLIFSFVTLITGVMISIYILKTKWEYREELRVQTLIIFWIVFPYIMSLIVLFIPAVPINKALKNYKIEQQIIFKNYLKKIHKSLENEQLAATKRHELYENYEFQMKLRTNLYLMRTWPYSLESYLKYFGSIIINSLISSWSILSKDSYILDVLKKIF